MGFAETTEIPQQFALTSVSPNPFNTRCRIKFSTIERGRVTLTLYDLLGRKIKSLVNSRLDPGRHEVVWEGKDSFGVPVASGTYHLVLLEGELAATQRITLLK